MDETCVLRESRLLRDCASFMHDPTEGGFWGGVDEISRLAGLRADVDSNLVPIHEYTRRASEALGFDPLRLVASGCLLAVVGEGDFARAERAFIDAGINISRVGTFTDKPYEAGSGESGEELWGLLKRPRV